MHGSSGTGGRPTLVAYTRDDLRLWARMCARALAAAGATPASIVHNAYGYGLFTGGLGIHQGAIELGATVVPVSGGMTARQVTLITDLKPDILTCTPSYALRLGEALAEAGHVRTLPAGRHLRRRALDRRPAGPDPGPARPARPRHLRPVRDHRPRRRRRVRRGRRRPARQRGPLPRRGRRPADRRPRPRRHPRRARVHHPDQAGPAPAALPHRRHRRPAPRPRARAAAPWSR